MTPPPPRKGRLIIIPYTSLIYSEEDYSTILLLFVFSTPQLKGVEEGGNVVKWTEKEGDEEAKWYSWSVFSLLSVNDDSQEKAHYSKSSVDVYVKPRAKTPTKEEGEIKEEVSVRSSN